MPLCQLCDCFNLKNLLDNAGFAEDVAHHKSLGILERSATSCDLCRLFYNKIAGQIQQRDLGQLLRPIWEDSPLIVRGVTTLAGDDPDDYGRLCGVKLRCDKAHAEAKLNPVYFSIYVDNNDQESKNALCDVIVGEDIHPPEDAGPLLKEWIRDCEANHSTCSGPPGPLPTRVIDVGSDLGREPRLLVTHREVAHYIALSHCWGGKAHIVTCTTKATLEKNKEMILMSTLPKTFREAVMITRSLGIQYLWIDSLCIIQDDKRDWELESVKMGSIYSSAYLTIAAAASKDASGGCFLLRDRSNHVKVKYRLPKGSSKKFADVFVRPRPRSLRELNDCHLQTRAWVTQERVLSNRLIHYDVDQILWECRESRKAEDGVPETADVSAQASSNWDGQVKYQNGGHFVWDWHMMVEDYTVRNLSFADDKFPALSGIATIIEKQTGEEYVAGFWKKYMVPGLLWYRKPENWLSPPPTYRAPSWSWASLEGGVVMLGDYEGDFMFQNGDENPESRWVCTVKDIETETTPVGLDPNGRLDSGVLKLTGPLKEVDARIDPSTPEFESVPGYGTGHIDYLQYRGQNVGRAIFDQKYDQAHHNGPLYFMLVLVYRETQHAWRGLLLQHSEKHGKFRRVGYARELEGVRLWQADRGDPWFFDDAVEDTITVI